MPRNLMKTLVFASLTLTACSSSTNQVMVTPPPIRPIAAQAVRQPVAKGAESGKKQLLGSVMSVNPDCSEAGEPVVTVVKAPEHGQMTVERSEAYPSFPKENVRSACNSKKVAAISIYYTSNPSFSGTDTASTETLLPQGNLNKTDFVITVR